MNQITDLSHITDPSDFKGSRVPLLAQLDAVARCYICKELFRGPVVTNCNHTFCSQCIRGHLVSESKCPLCKLELFESQLRKDLVFDELTDIYRDLREQLVEVVSNERPASEGKNVGQEEIVSDDSIEVVEERKRSGERESKRQLDIDECDSECPICGKKMPADFIQKKHLDMCLQGRGESALPPRDSVPTKRAKSSILAFFKKTPSPRIVDPIDRAAEFTRLAQIPSESKRLPKLDFSSLTTPRLKERLGQLKLPTTGSRPQLELRYTQYEVLYNANLDVNHPQDERVLRQQLRQWEQSHLAFSEGKLTLFDTGKRHRNITDKQFLVAEWMEEYKHEFKQLERAARQLMTKSRDKMESPDQNTRDIDH